MIKLKQLKTLGIISLIIFSFFLTDFVTDIAINNNELMKTIKDSKDTFEISSVNAIIENNTIIPGINGKEVDEVESYLNMKDFGTFNKNYLIYKDVLPDISIENNKEKVIICGNKKRRNISILIKNNTEILNYCKKNNLKFTKLLKLEDNLENIDNINIESEYKKFKDLNTLMNKKELNNKICLINYSNIKECLENRYYLVKYNKEINNKNIINSKNIENGDIIYINDNLNLENFIILIKYIKNKDLKITYLSDLIKE